MLAAGLLIMQSERYSEDAVPNRQGKQSGEVAATWEEGSRLEIRNELILGCVDRDIHPVLRGTGRLLAMPVDTTPENCRSQTHNASASLSPVGHFNAMDLHFAARQPISCEWPRLFRCVDQSVRCSWRPRTLRWRHSKFRCAARLGFVLHL